MLEYGDIGIAAASRRRPEHAFHGQSDQQKRKSAPLRIRQKRIH